MLKALCRQLYLIMCLSLLRTVLFSAIITCLFSCRQAGLYERLQNIPGGEWKSGNKASFSLEVNDTVSPYNFYATIRHTNLYPYRNIWIRVGLTMPGTDSATYQDFELPLADNEKWLGTGLNDVYDRRVKLFGFPQHFSKKGTVVFTIQQIMRDDPLPGVLQAGIRIEPVLGE